MPELISAGPEVVGPACSDTSAAAIEKLGAQAHPGDLSVLAARTGGAINPLVSRTSQSRDADHAIRHLQQGRPFGKVVSVP
ncbi:hypothetical protein BBK82_37895 [Lentzea guizhouensis]|uniref:Uncharacterized protein n=1 Tax=Lentzea guizhouensis TaxID=1586287 RepID=A0A1B2HT66_9PSEU|nr:hypothetical protein BBK82_37895 [Lentzea guizhouensis]